MGLFLAWTLGCAVDGLKGRARRRRRGNGRLSIIVYGGRRLGGIYASV